MITIRIRPQFGSSGRIAGIFYWRYYRNGIHRHRRPGCAGHDHSVCLRNPRKQQAHRERGAAYQASRYGFGVRVAYERQAKPGELGKEDLSKVLDYLERRKVQLTEALKKIEESGGNQICTTDPECRVMKSRDGLRPSFNVQTAVESENHLIVHYDVTDECVDWNLLKAGIDASKEALDVENIEGIADRGYSNSDEILDCLLAGDTPTTHPNKGEKNRIFRFNKITDEITEEMKKSTDPEVLKKCIAAGVLPDVLHREDIELETFKRRETGTSVYMKTPGSSTSLRWWKRETRPT